MNIITVDARGLVCPKPLIMTKAALEKLAVGQEMDVVIDNETSRQNIERFLKDNGATSSCTENAGEFTLRIRKQNAVPGRPNTQEYCIPHPSSPSSNDRESKKSAVILFKSDKMGCGPDDLGAILMKAFINTIKEIFPLPSALVFYTDGIHLTVEGSPVVDPIRELESRGVKILVCGTCLDYFKKKASLEVGIVSNMYAILETLSSAHHVITP
jgi:selenium metabolism protein YedF